MTLLQEAQSGGESDDASSDKHGRGTMVTLQRRMKHGRGDVGNPDAANLSGWLRHQRLS